MNGVRLVFYMDGRGGAPVKKWMDDLPERVRDKCMAKLSALKRFGHQLGPPTVKALRDGILELRVSSSGNQYRILFFFCPGKIVVLAHAFIKKGQKVPNREIDKALQRKAAFEADPEKHSYQ